jgi:hypothetical protein
MVYTSLMSLLAKSFLTLDAGQEKIMIQARILQVKHLSWRGI